MENKDSMVMYGSVYLQFQRLISKGKQEEALAYIKAILEYGFEGVMPDEDDNVWLYGFDSNIIAIDNAAVRYAKAQENGSKGGRPKINLNKEEVMEKKAELKTWGAVAKYYGVTERTLYSYRKEWESEKLEKTEIGNQKKLSSDFPENFRNGKNLNVNVNVTENENVTYNDEASLQDMIGADGFVVSTGEFLPEEELLARRRLRELNFSQEQVDYIFANIIV